MSTRKNTKVKAVPQEVAQEQPVKQLVIGIALEANDPLQLFPVTQQEAAEVFATYVQHGTFGVYTKGGRAFTTYTPHSLGILTVEAQYSFDYAQKDQQAQQAQQAQAVANIVPSAPAADAQKSEAPMELAANEQEG